MYPLHTPPAASPRYKRIFDLFVACLCLLFSWPIFLLIYILHRLTSKDSAFYKQERIGMGGKPFQIIKFRTLHANAEKDGPQLTGKDADPVRFTPMGKWLREHNLDELPQLWNVVKGEMSIVGYRPERPFFIKQIIEQDARYPQLYSTRPGITSYATIYNGYTDTMEKMLRRLEMDLGYLQQQSLSTDLHIIFKTFCLVLKG